MLSSSTHKTVNTVGHASAGQNAVPIVDLDTKALSQLNSKEAKSLLDTVDELRALQVGEIVHLPQIIVVGDQSAGKSSDLEAISRVRFPTKGGLCTRFATELILRKAARASVGVKIILANPEHGSQDAGQSFERSEFSMDDLPQIIEEATDRMGLNDAVSGGFSKDILRVEVSGSDVYPLTLVDLPGFFQSAVQGQTTDGKKLVDQLAKAYMQQKNSIILAVVSANYQVTNQQVLREFKKYDPTMQRTLGIVTKPDLPHPGSDDERQAITLANGQDSFNRLPLGWHVLRNRTEFEGHIGVSDRDAHEEEFFQQGNWSVIPPRSRGAATLRRKLSDVLLKHIQQSLPGLLADIDSNLVVRQKELEQLGAERSEPKDIRIFLVKIAAKFERLARDAVNGNYGDEFFGNLHESDRKLRSLIRNLNRAFGLTVAQRGASETVVWDEVSNEIDGPGNGRVGSEVDHGSQEGIPDTSCPIFVDDLDKGTHYLQSYLDLYKAEYPTLVTESALRLRIESLASINQGKEFPGWANPDLVIDLFKSHAKPWEAIARSHIVLVTNFCTAFVEDLLRYVVGDDQETLEALLRLLVDRFFDKQRQTLEAKLAELLRPYKAGYGLALEGELRQKLGSRTTDRTVCQMTQVLGDDRVQSSKRQNRDETIRIVLESRSTGLSDFGTEKIIDMMLVHYEMSRRTFTDNVINLGLESCLTNQIETILTPAGVSCMSDEELVNLAGESECVKTARRRLQQQTATLKDGLAKCLRNRPRQVTAIPSLATPDVRAGPDVSQLYVSPL